jgi:hypothetical protein
MARESDQRQLDALSSAELDTQRRCERFWFIVTSSTVNEDLGISAESRLQEQFQHIAEAEWHLLYRAALRAGLDGQTAESVVRRALWRAYCSLLKMPQNERSRLKVRVWLSNVTAQVVERALHA